MPNIVLKNGDVIAVSDNPSPQEMAMLEELMRRENPSFLDRGLATGKNLLRGALGSYTGATSLAAPYMPLAGINKAITDAVVGGNSQELPTRLFPIPEKETPAQRLLRAGEEGVGGALATGPAIALKGPKALSILAGGGYTGGVGGEAGGMVGENVTADPTWKSRFKLLGSVLGGFAGGLPVNLLGARWAGLGQNAAETTLRRDSPSIGTSTSPPSPAWKTAAENVKDFNATGVKTATLAEAFPPDSMIAARARSLMGERGGETLVDKITGRTDDLVELRNRTLDAVAPPKGAEGVTSRAVNAGNTYLQRLDQARGNAYRALLAKVPELDPAAVQFAYDSLKALSLKTQGKAEKAALEEVADSLMQANKVSVPQPPKYVRDAKGLMRAVPQDPKMVEVPKTNLDKALVDVKDVQSSTMSSSKVGGKQLNAGEYRQAYNLTMDMLKVLTPVLPNGKTILQQAEERFANYTHNVIEPAERGAIGQVVGNPDSPIPAASRLKALVDDQSPGDITRNLNRMEWATGDVDLKKDIARTILAQKTASQPSNMGKVLRGDPGSDTEKSIAALLTSAGAPVDKVNQAMRVSDALQTLRRPSMAPEQLPSNIPAAVVRPNRAIDLGLSGMSKEARNEFMAKLLADPNNWDELRRIAMYDPWVRAQLTIATSLQNAMQGAK